jgi:cullin 1
VRLHMPCTHNSVLSAVDLSVLVLATGSWPLQPPSTNFLVPKELRLAEDMFYKFYQNQHQVGSNALLVQELFAHAVLFPQGRKLTWLHQLSKGEIKARFAGKIFTFQASTYVTDIF